MSSRIASSILGRNCQCPNCSGRQTCLHFTPVASSSMAMNVSQTVSSLAQVCSTSDTNPLTKVGDRPVVSNHTYRKDQRLDETEQLSDQVTQSLQLRDTNLRKDVHEKRPEDDSDVESPDEVPSKKRKPLETKHKREEEPESSTEELAGYLDELYLPRDAVSADVALMAELMYT